MRCCVVSTSRNIPHQEVRLALREHGRCPQQQICFKSMSISCEAKCASSFRMHRLVSKMSADRLISLLQAKLICVSKGKKRDLTLLTCTLTGGSGVERKIQPSSHTRRKLKGKDSPSLAVDGQEMIAPWSVDVTLGHGEAHTDQNEALGKHCSKSCSTGTLLHFVCGCTFVCVSLCDCKFKSACRVHVVCMCLFPVSLTPKLISLTLTQKISISSGNWRNVRLQQGIHFEYYCDKSKMKEASCL